MSGRPDTKGCLCDTCGHPIIKDQYDVQVWERKGLVICPTSEQHACIERASKRLIARATRHASSYVLGRYKAA